MDIDTSEEDFENVFVVKEEIVFLVDSESLKYKNQEFKKNNS